jgi:hypothetical protein
MHERAVVGKAVHEPQDPQPLLEKPLVRLEVRIVRRLEGIAGNLRADHDAVAFP